MVLINFMSIPNLYNTTDIQSFGPDVNPIRFTRAFSPCVLKTHIQSGRSTSCLSNLPNNHTYKKNVNYITQTNNYCIMKPKLNNKNKKPLPDESHYVSMVFPIAQYLTNTQSESPDTPETHIEPIYESINCINKEPHYNVFDEPIYEEIDNDVLSVIFSYKKSTPTVYLKKRNACYDASTMHTWCLRPYRYGDIYEPIYETLDRYFTDKTLVNFDHPIKHKTKKKNTFKQKCYKCLNIFKKIIICV